MFDRFNRKRAESAAAQANEIHPFKAQGVLAREDIRRNIFGHPEASSDHCVLTHMNKLMDRRQPADNRPITEMDVSAEGGTICQDHIVPQLAIVRHVAIRHEEAIVADSRDPAFDSRPVEGYELPNDNIVADLEKCLLTGIFEVLRRTRDRSPVENPAPGSNPRSARDHGIGPHGGSVANDNIIFNDGKRPDGHTLPELRLGTDDRTLINLNAHLEQFGIN